MKNVKKLLALLLAMAMLFALCACGGDDDKKKDDKDDDKKPAASQSANADPSTKPSQNNQNNTQSTTNNHSDTANKAPVGSWLLEEEDVIFTLNYDGTGELDGEDINWELLSNNSLRLFGEDDDDEVILTFAYNGDSVSFTDPDGDVTVWVKYTGSTEEDPDIDVDFDDDDVDFEDDEDDVDAEVTYDDDLIATWYMDDMAMVLDEGGMGGLYRGDTGADLYWGIVDGALILVIEDEEYYALYEVDGDTLTLIYDDGTIETWER